jgi:hypothetical protein
LPPPLTGLAVDGEEEEKLELQLEDDVLGIS